MRACVQQSFDICLLVATMHDGARVALFGTEVEPRRRCSRFVPFPCNACVCSAGCMQLPSLPPSPTDVSHLPFSTSTPCRHICFLKSCKWSYLVAVLSFYPDLPLLLPSRREKQNPPNLAEKKQGLSQNAYLCTKYLMF